MIEYISPFFIAVVAALLATPFIIKLAFLVGALDRPNRRKVHHQIMPRLGGLGIYIGFIISVLLFLELTMQLKGMILGGTIILLVGIVDDIRGISPLPKLMGQIFAALTVAYMGITVNFINNPFDGLFELGPLAIPFTVLWIVSITNAVNLIDGLDGLASGISTIALLTFSIISFSMGHVVVPMLALALAGAVVGFLRFNFFPARIFLGDSGSMFLGFNIAVLAVFGLLKGVTLVAFVIPIIVLGVPILDTGFAIIRRFYRRKPIFQPDKSHIHHRLLRRGYSHRQVVMIIYFISLCFSATAILVTRNMNIFF